MHGGAGGIGTFAIQLAAGPRRRGASRPPARPEKLELCRSLGARRAINYRDEDFVEVLKEAGGADVILDNMGASYLGRNVSALATEGRLVVIGMQGGAKGELDLNALLRKRGVGDRDLAAGAAPRREGRDLRGGRRERLAPRRRRPGPPHRRRPRCPLEDVARAHQLMETARTAEDPALDGRGLSG